MSPRGHEPDWSDLRLGIVVAAFFVVIVILLSIAAFALGAQSKFVPFAFLELLGRTSMQSIVPGDHAKLDMTVLYADLRGFTSLT